jgi:hypothetical protein
MVCKQWSLLPQDDPVTGRPIDRRGPYSVHHGMKSVRKAPAWIAESVNPVKEGSRVHS